LLARSNGQYFFRQFGETRSNRNLYNGLDTKAELVVLTKHLEQLPSHKSYFIMKSKRERIINFEREYFNEALNTVSHVLPCLKENAIYALNNNSCKYCKFYKDCWI